jgi:hypothetical protein
VLDGVADQVAEGPLEFLAVSQEQQIGVEVGFDRMRRGTPLDRLSRQPL